MTRQPLRVVKLGGSLLDCADLGHDLRRWLDGQTPAGNVLIAGGGRFADLVRQADHQHGLDERTAHWLCVWAMRITARLVAEIVPGAALTDDFGQLSAGVSKAYPTVFDVWSFLREDEPSLPGTHLQENWDVTSDAIAARVAVAIKADELVLLKSALPVRGASIERMAEDGYVDRFFQKLADELPPVRVINLRADGFPGVALPDCRR